MKVLEVTQVLVDALKSIDGSETFNYNLYGEVSSTMKFIHEINSFPSVCISLLREDLQRVESGLTFTVLSYEIRGYTHDHEQEESGERLSEDIEQVLDTVSRTSDLHEVRLISVETDSGLNRPYGACKFKVQVWITR